MKKCLISEKLVNDGDPNKKIKFGEKEFLNAVNIISEDILKNYSKDLNKIGLIGVARGGLPLTVAVSHRIGVREINSFQVKMTNSNERWDYGETQIVNYEIDDNIDEYIVFEDIVSHGRSINAVVNELKKHNKKVKCIYSLFMNSDMKELKIDDEYMDIKYVHLINGNQWVYFLWEKDYEKE